MILVDSNILIDVLRDDQVWGAWSMRALEAAGDADQLAINPLIYAEVAVRYEATKDLDDDLGSSFVRLDLPYEAAFLAGRAFAAYRVRGGPRQSLLPDFLIGAHAAFADMTLLTRDARRYRTAYPRLKLITP